MNCIIASSNPGKARELEELMREYFPFLTKIICQAAQNVSEDATTFIGNSQIKARALFKELKTSIDKKTWIIADDSGLAVDALGGAPGIYSARYGGEHGNATKNMSKVLCELNRVGAVDMNLRMASYHCALTLIEFDPQAKNLYQKEYSADGLCHGRIAFAAEGLAGFGYDPIFIEAKSGKTLGVLDYAYKNAFSHRRQAIAQLKRLMDCLAEKSICS